MLFNSFEFILLFLPIVFIGFYLIGARSHVLAAGWLAAASLFFYAWWSFTALPLLLGSILTNYWFGAKLSQFNQTSKGKRFLFCGVTLNLVLLGYFKYAGFFVGSLNNALQNVGIHALTVPQIVLPIGISFYTFTQIAFLVDCWQGKVKERRFIHYVLFVTYFPHLIAGPILHHSQMMPQFAEKSSYKINYDKIIVGIVLFVIGLSKKMLIADPLSFYADGLFNMADSGQSEISFFTAWAGVLSYTFQIYFDFSGYSDMAIGLSLLFGIKIPINFNSPYRATSIIDFWRRWHISLSTFLRDYLYIPLGGNKYGKFRRYSNLFTTMLLGGLWHGASWNFVLWGALHGIYLSVNHAWKKFCPLAECGGIFYKLFSWALTFFFVCIAWVLFRANSLDSAKRVYVALFDFNASYYTEVSKTLIFLHADLVSKIIEKIYSADIVVKFNEIFALIISWLYSTATAFLGAQSLDGLQCLFIAIIIVLIPYNSNYIAGLLDVENKHRENSFIYFCLIVSFYYLIACLWLMDKHQVFIYFQF